MKASLISLTPSCLETWLWGWCCWDKCWEKGLKYLIDKWQVDNGVFTIWRQTEFGVTLLSPSGDLGIRLVWHNLSPPDRTGPPLFSPTVEILFKLNQIIYDGSSVVLRMISDDFRCFPVFLAVFRCFQLGCNYYPARAMRALGLLLADSAPIVG